jgi:ABC transporter substrate binding protein
MSFLQELEVAISKGSAESRQRALWYATDLLIAGRYTEDEVWTFGEIIERLEQELEVVARARLAKRLARTDNAPSSRSLIESSSSSAAFKDALSAAGYVEGQSLGIEYRWAEGHPDRLPALAEDLVQRGVALIFAAGGAEPARATAAVTSTIPIVFTSAIDPVKAGLVSSLNRPGGNVTGVSLIGSALEAKRLGLCISWCLKPD